MINLVTLKTQNLYTMKKALRILFMTVLIIAATVVLNTAFGQPMPGGDPGPGGQGGTPVGGYVPIGSGMIMMLIMGAVYGTRKIYNATKKRILE